MKKTFGIKLAEARRRNELTQQQVADELDVSMQAVSAWERDEYLPDTDNLLKVSGLLGVSIPSLAFESEYEFEPKKEIFNWHHMKTFVKTTAKNLKLVNSLRALEFAIDAHIDQKRKNSDIPYIYHPLNLACHCLAMGITDDSVIAACLLHDVIEDCGAVAEELPVDDSTRELVVLLSHGDDGQDRSRMLKEYYGGIAGNPKAALVKCVDRYNNLSTMSWGLRRERQLRVIYETERYILPLLKVVKDTPEFNNAAWLLQYGIESMLDIYKRLL